MKRSCLLDSLRILAIGLVLLAHFGQLLNTSPGGFFGIKNFYYVSLGGVGVSLFLILSGLLAGLVDSAKRTSYAEYLLKKVLRIYPIYWISVPITIVGYLLGNWLMKGNVPTLFPNGFIVDVLGSVTGFYSWVGLWGGPYNSPSWFIALIMTMYALFPPILYAIKRWPHITLLTLFIISVGARYYVGLNGVPFIDKSILDDVEGWLYRLYGFMPGRPGDWFPPCRLFEFGLGVYLALKLPNTIWFALRTPIDRWIQRCSDLAFPLFLIHYPYLFVVLYLTELGLPLPISTLFYLAGLIWSSWYLSQLDQRVPRQLVTAKVIPK